MIEFKNILEIGNLYNEKVLFAFDKIPIVFVCHNINGDRFLCLCTDCIVGYSWMITQVERDILIKLIKDEVPILEVFKRSEGKIYIVDRDKDKYSYNRYDYADIPINELPDENERLENPFLKDYLRQLELEDVIEHANLESNSESMCL